MLLNEKRHKEHQHLIDSLGHSNKTSSTIAINVICTDMFHTSCGSQCGKLIFSDGEASVVVGGDPEVVPGGGVQVEDHKVAARLDVVGDHAPVLLVLGFVLHHKVDDGTASIQPSIKVQGHTTGDIKYYLKIADYLH